MVEPNSLADEIHSQFREQEQTNEEFRQKAQELIRAGEIEVLEVDSIDPDFLYERVKDSKWLHELAQAYQEDGVVGEEQINRVIREVMSFAGCISARRQRPATVDEMLRASMEQGSDLADALVGHAMDKMKRRTHFRNSYGVIPGKVLGLDEPTIPYYHLAVGIDESM